MKLVPYIFVRHLSITLGSFLLLPIFSENKHFTIIVTSYNNEEWCIKNLESIFSQNYDNFEVIYINDASTDQTGILVQSYIKQYFLEKKCIYKENQKRSYKLYNLYHAIHSCPNKSIIVEVDGDDWLAHPNVLSILNEVYQNENVWLTYGQFEWSDTGQRGFCELYSPPTVINNTFRESVWQASQLRTFYAKLFKLINKKDLLHRGNFIPIAGDLAAFYPMLEMAQERHACIKDVLYIYNVFNPLNDFKINPRKQLIMDYIIRKKRKYRRIPKLWE